MNEFVIATILLAVYSVFITIYASIEIPYARERAKYYEEESNKLYLEKYVRQECRR